MGTSFINLDVYYGIEVEIAASKNTTDSNNYNSATQLLNWTTEA
jgi:hypothetical protein